ncbi:hypothetical protein FRC08_003056 [Ceratobasidium sp. 394]|nr:hypothetical protein FRC08_003056 [Ceratobasidium sp. 394]
MTDHNSAGRNTAASQVPAAPKRDSEFYFDDTLVVIMVDDTLFKVHKYQLMKSEVFSDMFKMTRPSSEGPEEGSSPENPIVLSGVAASDFRSLLRMLYTTQFSMHRVEPDASLIIPAFRLANKWNFEDLRAHLLPLAEKELDDIDKIVFAREFGIKEWLTPAHLKLFQRTTPFTSEEAAKLGVQSLLLISRLRDGMHQVPPGTYACYSCSGYQNVFTGNSNYRCGKCNTLSYVLIPGSNVSSGAGNGTIETKIKKWVEDGCIFTE